MAARIREIAEAHRVPLVANPPLARALYQLEVDTEIAPEHYKAVAEIIAYVWRLARPGRPPGELTGVMTGEMARDPAAAASGVIGAKGSATGVAGSGAGTPGAGMGRQ